MNRFLLLTANLVTLATLTIAKNLEFETANTKTLNKYPITFINHALTIFDTNFILNQFTEDFDKQTNIINYIYHNKIYNTIYNAFKSFSFNVFSLTNFNKIREGTIASHIIVGIVNIANSNVEGNSSYKIIGSNKIRTSIVECTKLKSDAKTMNNKNTITLLNNPLTIHNTKSLHIPICKYKQPTLLRLDYINGMNYISSIRTKRHCTLYFTKIQWVLPTINH